MKIEIIQICEIASLFTCHIFTLLCTWRYRFFNFKCMGKKLEKTVILETTCGKNSENLQLSLTLNYWKCPLKKNIIYIAGKPLVVLNTCCSLFFISFFPFIQSNEPIIKSQYFRERIKPNEVSTLCSWSMLM